MKRPRILVVGSFMMDLIASASRVPNMGETVIGSSFRTAPGGKGVNQAVQCARLGADVTMVGCVGNDSFGREMCQAASAAGVDVSRVKISGKSSSGVGNIQLQVTEQGVQNRILVVPGANYDLSVEDLDWLREGIRKFDILLLQLELTMPVTRFAARCARDAGVPVMLNPAPAAELDDELLSCISYLSPNEHEAALLSGVTIRVNEEGANEEDIIRAARELNSKGVGKVLITLGSNGSAMADGENIHRTACASYGPVKDPTAAGDSFVGAFCTGLISGLSEYQAMDFASFTAGITVSEMGAIPSLPALEKVLAFMKDKNYTGFDLKVLDFLKR
ncbi:MAG: ribokinase [Spirochaetales bacterium]|nr:ribokinase [Spirochaetales bacterium]